MANKPQPNRPEQHFPDNELLFCRVRRNNFKRNGRASPLAFGLPDMSVNREQFSTAEQARKGHNPEDWGVVSFPVSAIPPREEWVHVALVYRMLPRHVPVDGNFAHSEVRVWRKNDAIYLLVTSRTDNDFGADDPDQTEARCPPDELDPDFHMRWRKHIALACKTEILPDGGTAAA